MYFIKNPTDSGGDEQHIEEEIRHLAGLATDARVTRSFKDKHSLIQKEGALISDVKYEVKIESQLVGATKPKPEVVLHSELLTVDEHGSKIRTKSQKF